MNLLLSNVPAFLLPIIIDETGVHLSPFSWGNLCLTVLALLAWSFGFRVLISYFLKKEK